MYTQSILGSVTLGKDTTGNFKQSIYGLAVRATTDGKFIARHKNKYMDVTTGTIDGTDNLVYRLPVKMPKPGDIIIRADDPFSVLFVEKIDDTGNVTGFDPSTEDIVEYRPVTNMFNLNFFIKVVGPDNLLGGKNSDDLLPLMLLSGQGAAGNSNDSLSTLLLMKSFGKESLDDDDSMLPFLLLSSQKNAGIDPLALMLALKGSKHFDFFEDTHEENPVAVRRHTSKNE